MSNAPETKVLNALLHYYTAECEQGQSALETTKERRNNITHLLAQTETAQKTPLAGQKRQFASNESALESNKRANDHDTATDLQKYIMIVEQARVAQKPAARGYILFLHYSADSRSFCDHLLDALSRDQSKYRILIAPKFVNRTVVSLFETTMAQTLGLVPRVHDNIDQYAWDDASWKRHGSLAHSFLDACSGLTSNSDHSAASERMQRDFVREELARRRWQHIEQTGKRYAADFQQFLLWLANCLESMRTQLLPHYSFFVFAHMYLDLVWLENDVSGASVANDFFKRFVCHFEHRRDLADLLAELTKTKTRTLMCENQVVCRMRGLPPPRSPFVLPAAKDASQHATARKRTLRVSRECYYFLQHAMRMDAINRSVQTVTRAYIDFKVLDSAHH